MAAPPEGQAAKPTDAYEVIRVTIGYLENNRSRMDYPRYRRAGLPTCSALVESLIKQINRRVKGTEKFWNPTNAEKILQLRAAYLSEDDRLNKHLKTRPINAFRRYQTEKRGKLGNAQKTNRVLHPSITRPPRATRSSSNAIGRRAAQSFR